MSVFAYEITLDGGTWVGITDADDATAIPATLGAGPLILPPPDRSTQNPETTDLRPKNAVSTIVYAQDVSWINMHQFVSQRDDMVLLSDIQLQPPVGSLPAIAYVAIVRPGQHPIVIASGDWDTVLDTLRDCTAPIPASWGLVIRMENGVGAALPGTIYFTAEQLEDTGEIADATSNFLRTPAQGVTTIQEDGVDVTTNAEKLNFVGANWTLTPSPDGTCVDVETTSGGAGGTPELDTFTGLSLPTGVGVVGVLSSAPASLNSVILDLNGAVKQLGVEFTIAGTTLSWAAGLALPIDTSDVIQVHYAS